MLWIWPAFLFCGLPVGFQDSLLAGSDGTCSLEQLWQLSDLFEISWCFSIFPVTEE